MLDKLSRVFTSFKKNLTCIFKTLYIKVGKVATLVQIKYIRKNPFNEKRNKKLQNKKVKKNCEVLYGSLGLIIGMLNNGQKLIDSCYLRSGRNIFLTQLKDVFLDYCLIISR
jgi:hypothetical protein